MAWTMPADSWGLSGRCLWCGNLYIQPACLAACLPACVQAKYNVMEALVYLGPFTLAFLGGGAYLFEWDQGLSTEVGWRAPLVGMRNAAAGSQVRVQGHF